MIKILLVFLVSATAVFGQEDSIEQLWDLYGQGDFQQVIEKGMVLARRDSTNAVINLAIGRSMFDLGNWEQSQSFLEVAVESDTRQTWVYAWGQVYLGRCHILAGDLDLATHAFTRARECGATKNATRTAAMNLRGLGLDEYFDDWILVETDHFEFHFSPRLGIMDRSGFVADREAAYKNISEWFGGGPEEKIRFFVWADSIEAEMAGLPPLGFARATYHLIHAHVKQTRGHEITHVIAYHAGNPISTTGLINEGMAVFHDQTGRDKIQVAQKALEQGKINQESTPFVAVGVRALWNDWSLLSDIYTYPIAGAWVDRLLAKGGQENFLKLSVDQTYASAKEIYGPELQSWLDEFEAEIGIKN